MRHETIVSLKDVFVTYETLSGRIVALRGVTLDIREKELVIIKGPSGSGKTTLFKLILGLVKPFSGTVTVFGLDPSSKEHVYRIRKNIGYSSQEGLFVKNLTIRENIDLYLKGRRVKVDKDKILALANRIGVEKILDKFPDQLSGGEKKRAELLMVLTDKPPLLLLDEPTAMLDSENVRKIVSLIGELKGQTTIIIATHDERLSSLGDREIYLIGGELAHDTYLSRTG